MPPATQRTPPSPAGSTRSQLDFLRGHRVAGWLIAAGAITLWLRLWWHQRQVWNSDSELMFGWAMPGLIAFLFYERWLERPAPEPAPGRTPARALAWTALGVGGAAWGLAAVVLSAYPLWTAFLWLQNGAAIALTLGALVLAGGLGWARALAFPLLFSFTALPWPSGFHDQLGQALMRGITLLATFLLNQGGIPAVASGNLIQVSTGWVGVEEACSGLRSLQASVMMALFLGEYHHLRSGRRFALVGSGLGLALVSNLLRTYWLTWQAARHGPEAVHSWHDSAGYAALVFNATGLALVAWAWCRPRVAVKTPVRIISPSAGAAMRWGVGVLTGLLLLTEAGVHAWYARGTEPADARHLASWRLAFPESAAGYTAMPFPPETLRMLACDQARGATWTSSGGGARAAYVVDWEGGRGGPEITRLHNPLVCLPASGASLVADEGFVSAELAGRTERFRAIRFTDETRSIAVFFTVLQVGQSTGLPDGVGPGQKAGGAADEHDGEHDAHRSDTRLTWWRERWAGIGDGRRPGATRIVTFAFWELAPGTEIETLRATLAELVTTLPHDHPPSPEQAAGRLSRNDAIGGGVAG